jgi:bromodomain and WD repeat domain-containing protein 1/3
VVVEDAKRRPRVTMVGWNADDSLVLTAVSDRMIKVWNARNGELVRVFKDHSDEAYVIEAHPFNPRIMCTAGHDGKLIIWDVGTTKKDDSDKNIGKVFEYNNQLGEAQGYGSLFDCKWSPDGFSIAVTDSHGHVLLLTIGGDQMKKFKKLPPELFFHTDYRPIIRDAITHEVLDEQTQVPPHSMPPPFLVDVDGNPYPPQLQRLVPGRENIKEEQLIPNVAVGASGYQEVIEGIPVRSNIDEMIHQLAIEQGLERERGDLFRDITYIY